MADTNCILDFVTDYLSGLPIPKLAKAWGITEGEVNGLLSSASFKLMQLKNSSHKLESARLGKKSASPSKKDIKHYAMLSDSLRVAVAHDVALSGVQAQSNFFKLCSRIGSSASSFYTFSFAEYPAGKLSIQIMRRTFQSLSPIDRFKCLDALTPRARKDLLGEKYTFTEAELFFISNCLLNGELSLRKAATAWGTTDSDILCQIAKYSPSLYTKLVRLSVDESMVKRSIAVMHEFIGVPCGFTGLLEKYSLTKEQFKMCLGIIQASLPDLYEAFLPLQKASRVIL